MENESTKSILVSPAAEKLPVEILSEILTAACTENFIHRKSTLLDLPAITFGRVCSFWRLTALSTPRIWSHIRLRIIHDYILDCDWIDDPLSLLRLYFERSGAVSLSLDLAIKTNSNSFDDGTSLHPLLQCLAKESYRWHNVKWDIPYKICTSEVFAPIRENLPHLESITFCMDLNFADDRIPVFENCPNLRHVSLPGHEMQILITRGQCTSLDLGPGISNETWDDDLLWNPFSFPNLHNLELVQLQTDFGSGRSLDDFDPWLMHSGCNITSLSLTGLRSYRSYHPAPLRNRDFMVSLLRLLPSLVSLTIRDSPKLENPYYSDLHYLILTDYLYPDSDVDLALPKLESLEFAMNPAYLDWTWQDRLRNMVTARADTTKMLLGTRLRACKLIIYEDDEDDRELCDNDLSPLRSLYSISDGFTFDLFFLSNAVVE